MTNNEEERILGIDYGQKRIGIAISDPLRLIAYPLETVERKRIEDSIRRILEKYSIEYVIIGYPLRTDGKLGKRGEEVKSFAEKIKEKFNINIKLWDERYTTIEAERIIRDIGKKPSRDKGRVDRVAASLILQSYLDYLKRNEESDDFKN